MSSCESRGNIRPEISGTIRFNDVNFTYPERPEAPVLKDMKLKISEGECVAIVGASGSGKSTIFQWKPLAPHVLHFFPYLISSSVMGILYTNLVIDTDILLSIVILSSLYGLSKALARPSSSFSQWPFIYGSHSYHRSILQPSCPTISISSSSAIGRRCIDAIKIPRPCL
jgi:hypothetical protein